MDDFRQRLASKLSVSCNYHSGSEKPSLPFQLQGGVEIPMKGKPCRRHCLWSRAQSAAPCASAWVEMLLRAWGASVPRLADLSGDDSQLPACLRTHGTNGVRSRVL